MPAGTIHYTVYNEICVSSFTIINGSIYIDPLPRWNHVYKSIYKLYEEALLAEKMENTEQNGGVRYTRYIKDLAEQSGRTYAETQFLWDKCEQEVKFQQMMNPVKYSRLHYKDGSLAVAIDALLREKLGLNPYNENR